MARPVMLGNGSLTVGLNEAGLVHDFYYPYVGLDNLTTARGTEHKIGVWIEGKFSWVDDGSWTANVDFEADAMVSEIRLHHPKLAVELRFKDFVDSEFNAFCRQVTVSNLDEKAREIRLFLHQAFQISRAGRADTALFVPESNYILDYKGRCSLVIYGQDASQRPFDQFAIGVCGIEGKEGTFRDAEDGELSGSPVEHGGIDSVMRFVNHLAPRGAATVDYWVIAADSQYNGEKIHEKFIEDGLDKRLELTRQEWHGWLKIAEKGIQGVSHHYQKALQKSLMIIKVHSDKRGGIIASCDSSIYNYGRDYYSYVWPRDGAYAIWPLIRLGYIDEPRAFFEFCRDIMNPDGYLMHKYQPDRAIGSTWHPLLHGKHKELAIQEDETAIVIYMLGEYHRSSQDTDFIRNLYNTMIQPAANFMASFIDDKTGLPHASYDLWEEKFLTNTYTVAVTYQALLTAADFADMFEYPDDAVRWRQVARDVLAAKTPLFDPSRQAYRKGYLLGDDGTLNYDNTLDVSSLYGVAMFGYYDDDLEPLERTLEAIESILLGQSPSGGSPRYEHDHYFESEPAYMGNPWFVTTLWLAQYYIKLGDTAKAQSFVDWTLKQALPSGVLSEQIDPVTAEPKSVTPLVWSHAELINTLLDLPQHHD